MSDVVHDGSQLAASSPRIAVYGSRQHPHSIGCEAASAVANEAHGRSFSLGDMPSGTLLEKTIHEAGGNKSQRAGDAGHGGPHSNI